MLVKVQHKLIRKCVFVAEVTNSLWLHIRQPHPWTVANVVMSPVRPERSGQSTKYPIQTFLLAERKRVSCS